MKKILLFSVLLLFFLQNSVVFAHPGRTDHNGGHTCRTKCEQWGLKYDEYHLHIEDLSPKKVKTEAKSEIKKQAKKKAKK